MIICVLLFILFFAVSLREWYKYSQEKQRLMRKVENITLFGKHDVIKSESTYTKFLKKIFKYGDDFSDLGQRINFFSESHEVEDWLQKAGYPFDLSVERFQGIKIFLTIFGFLAGFVLLILGFPFSQYAMIFLPIAGYLGTILLLKNKAKSRQEKLRYDLPDFLDTVSVTLQAGVGLDQALREIVVYFDGPLHEEFSRFNQEIDLGVPREQAYRGLLKRNDNQEFQMLIKSLIQGMRLGVPIATTFKLQADEMRRLRKEQIKEKAAKASPKITLITTFLVAPTAILMIGGLVLLNTLFGENGLGSILG